MKNKILLGIFAILIGLFAVSCSDDDDYTVAKNALLTDGSVVTGSSDVTATTATMNGTVTGLEEASTSSYTTGFYYGSSEDALTNDVSASSASSFSATLTGQTANTVIYYQAYVTLQGRLTYKGEVKSLVTTDATAVTGDAKDIDYTKATISGSISKYPSGVTSGIVISTSSNVEDVRAGLIISASELSDNFDITKAGLLPNTTYYYATYLNLGSGIIYGEVKSFTTSSHEYNVDDDFVDLGLSVKWAKTNIGAEAESDFGGLFAFGDMNGCNNSIDPADYATADVYKTALDIAYATYDGKATMPTVQEFEELFSCCTKEWTTVDGVQGYKFTGPNGNSIFLPAAGSRTQNTISGEGSEGRYLTGSVNVNDSDYAMSYIFNSGTDAKTTTPVYQALSVRAVSTARNVALDKSLLYKTWEIDMKDDGTSSIFNGPVYFYGVDDSWKSLTNNQPVVGDSWSWEAGSDQTWAFDGATGCRGTMTLYNTDGKDSVTVTKTDKDGMSTTEKGAVTIDTKNMTITSYVDLLTPTNFVDPMVKNKKTSIKILTQSSKSLQLGFYRDSSPATLSVNYISQVEKYGFTAALTCYGDDASGKQNQTDAWSSANVTVPASGVGTYSVTFRTTEPRYNGKVYVLDIKDFAKTYPNAFVRVDAIQADGIDVPFDQNKFFFGDIEGNGNYRIEMANIWGCGKNESMSGLSDTPFHQGGGATTNETALAFNSTFTVTFTVVAIDADLDFSVKQTAVGMAADGSMPGNWGKETPAAITAKLNTDTHKYELENTDAIPLTLTAADCSNVTPANGAVNLVDIVGIRKYFPGFSAALQSVTNDGVDVPFTASKILYGDIEGNGNFRMELYNIWGSGTVDDPAFSGATVVSEKKCVTSLGFNTSSIYKIGSFSNNLYTIPW